MEPPKILDAPGEQWVPRLRRGNRVWLVKENEEAEIEYPYEPPEPGLRCGRIGIRRYGGALMGFQVWYVGLDGEGIDRSQLMRPIEGHLPENPEPLPEPLVRQLQRQVQRLDKRVGTLETAAWFRQLFME